MKNTSVSTSLSRKAYKSLSGWDRAISEAKSRIAALKRSIRTFQEMRERGVPFPEPPTSGSDEEVLGQAGVLGQSRTIGLCLKNDFLGRLLGQGNYFLGRLAEKKVDNLTLTR